jgi:hypothetical protein
MNMSSERYVQARDYTGKATGLVRLGSITALDNAPLPDRRAGEYRLHTVKAEPPDWHWEVHGVDQKFPDQGYTARGTLTIFRVNCGKTDGVGWGKNPGNAALAALEQAAKLSRLDIDDLLAKAAVTL